ncbi:acyltransferase family protein [Staphylococcus felis]|uniref:acyltransferase family protein n=1 Tax=Staphylococcus felis TaxID=46127 RepID=UPI000CD063EB|nr:acyltransferase family protein [Staphylococcus felis]AVP36708.1 acyltransferase [Staphylococcus felis]PNZ36781.1 acyltransferase [Staphylococcus felis]QQB03333.1 acyltransferase [Staphylococcus felis]
MANKSFTGLKRLKNPPRYLPGLDGLRAISVIGIIIYHLNAQWLSGGFLGVDTFFVISGYLITSLLMFEFENYGRINLVNFWIKRFKRLIPAMLFVTAFAVVYVLAFEHTLLESIKGDAKAALLYYSNWWYIFQDVDYFEQFKPMPLKHLWSLAVEEQFYILYPIILILILKIFKSRQKVIMTLLILSMMSAIWMIVVSMLDTNLSRAYFGTDTRLQTLLLGAIFAFVWPAFKLKANPPKLGRAFIDMVGTIALTGLIAIFWFVNEEQQWLYMGGFYVISLITLIVIASSVQPKGLLAKVLSNPLFAYIGKRSYSLYLWHYVIVTFIHKNFVAGQYPFYMYMLDVMLTFVMAEISYRYIETPFRHYGWRTFFQNRTSMTSMIRTPVILIGLSLLTLTLLGQFDSLAKTEQKQTAYKTGKHEKTNPPSDKNVSSKEKERSANDFKPEGESPLFIGDSLTVGMGNYLDEHYDTPTIDARVGRSIEEAIQVAPQYASYNRKGQAIVIQIGTNGDFNEEALQTLLSYFDKANVYLINTTVPRSYQSHVNKLLAKAAKKHQHVVLVDWHQVGIGHTEYFAYDGIHLEYPGIQKLVATLDEKMSEHQGPKAE